MSLQKKLINGDIEALEVVYKKYYPKVYGIVLKYCRDRVIGEDMAQEVFMKFWKNKHQIDLSLSIDHQLFVISRNIVYNFLKSQLRQRLMLEEYLKSTRNLKEEEEQEQEYNVEEQLASVHRLIDQLPKKQKEIFKMHRFEGLSYDEIANYYGISKHTVASHLTASMSYLRKNILLKISLLLFLVT
ncbi:sigma-70 family RNA polymerase sigma factor [Flavobacteriaceae bacterium F08102]|nr:sigma-70 family RNA polymerase sigma factor [Flavobacteriaceae bacterium F08102]